LELLRSQDVRIWMRNVMIQVRSFTLMNIVERLMYGSALCLKYSFSFDVFILQHFISNVLMFLFCHTLSNWCSMSENCKKLFTESVHWWCHTSAAIGISPENVVNTGTVTSRGDIKFLNLCSGVILFLLEE
jgi:hypothetical protein